MMFEIRVEQRPIGADGWTEVQPRQAVPPFLTDGMSAGELANSIADAIGPHPDRDYRVRVYEPGAHTQNPLVDYVAVGHEPDRSGDPDRTGPADRWGEWPIILPDGSGENLAFRLGGVVRSTATAARSAALAARTAAELTGPDRTDRPDLLDHLAGEMAKAAQYAAAVAALINRPRVYRPHDTPPPADVTVVSNGEREWQRLTPDGCQWIERAEPGVPLTTEQIEVAIARGDLVVLWPDLGVDLVLGGRLLVDATRPIEWDRRDGLLPPGLVEQGNRSIANLARAAETSDPRTRE